MAFGGVSITWDETAPADGRNAGLGAGDIRSIQSNLRGALDNEHVYPSSGGTAGAHRAGSVRVFYDTASRVSSTDTDGRLMFTSNTSNLYAVNSATTVLLGGRYAIHGSSSSYTDGGGTLRPNPVTQHWTIEMGMVSLRTNAAFSTLTFLNTFVQPAVVVVTLATSYTTYVNRPVVTAAGATTATITNVDTTSGASAPPGGVEYLVNYMAAGLVANG